MTPFRFRNTSGEEISPPAWLKVWAARYPEDDYKEHDELIEKHRSFSGADFEQIGKWKDGARTEGRVPNANGKVKRLNRMNLTLFVDARP